MEGARVGFLLVEGAPVGFLVGAREGFIVGALDGVIVGRLVVGLDDDGLQVGG